MKIFPLIAFGFFICSCTYSITMVHTEGQATDIVDETSTNAPQGSFPVPSIMPGLA